MKVQQKQRIIEGPWAPAADRVPAGHEVQIVAAAEAKNPATQLMQAAEPAEEVPAAQAEQSEAASWLAALVAASTLKVPAAQDVQLAAPVAVW